MLWGISAVVAVFINTIYSELATMFPEKSGGLALYAHEAWRKYTTLVGPIATFGYWIGWSVVLSVIGLFIGQIIQSTWFSGEPGGSPFGDGYFSTGLAPSSACRSDRRSGSILGVWLFNVFGVRVGVAFGYGAGVLLMIPLFVMMILPFLNGSFDSDQSDVQAERSRPRRGVASSSRSSGCGSCAGRRGGWTSVPPLRRSTRTRCATRSWRSARRRCSRCSSTSCSRSPSSAVARREARGGLRLRGRDGRDPRLDSACTDFFVVCLCVSFLISMNTATADGGRALFGISRDGMTIKQLGHPEQVPRARERDDARHGRQHLLRALHRQHLRHPRGVATSATCSRTCSRSRASCSCARTGRTGRDRSSSARSGHRSPGSSPSGA